MNANYYILTSERITARRALEIGLVSEIVSKEELH
jgi:enoyl-CoA hydratase/carnithine racemase